MTIINNNTFHLDTYGHGSLGGARRLSVLVLALPQLDDFISSSRACGFKSRRYKWKGGVEDVVLVGFGLARRCCRSDEDEDEDDEKIREIRVYPNQ